MRLGRKPPPLGRIGRKTAPKSMDIMINMPKCSPRVAAVYPKGHGVQGEPLAHPRRECVHGT